MQCIDCTHARPAHQPLPTGPLSFKVVGEIFANFKNEEVQGLLYPAFLEVLVDMMLEGNVNIAATLEKLHAPRPEVERSGSPATGRLVGAL